MSYSTYFTMTKSVMLATDQNLIIDISPDNKHMVINNISEETFIQLPFVTNSPLFRGYHSINKVDHFLNNNLNPTHILGASEICQGRFKAADALAFISGNTTFKPFKDGFNEGLSPFNMLSSLSRLSADVANLNPTDVVKYSITMKIH